MPSLTVFFPCYNDAKSIGKLISDADKAAKKLTRDYEIVVIDDGSSDNSRLILKRYRKRYKKLRLVFHEKNRGYGSVIKTGFSEAKKDWVFYTDGDGQYDVGELVLLWNLKDKEINFVNGIKMERNDYSYRVILGNIYALVVRWLFYLPTYDVDCDYRLINRKLVDKIDLSCNSGAVCIELVKKSQLVGAKIRQVSVHHYPRKYGSSQFFKIASLAQTGVELIGLWWRLIVQNGKN